MPQDDENVSQMNYLYGFYNTYKGGQTSYMGTVPNLKLKYNNTCTPKFFLEAKNEVDCLFNVYPKEWLITEVS